MKSGPTEKLGGLTGVEGDLRRGGGSYPGGKKPRCAAKAHIGNMEGKGSEEQTYGEVGGTKKRVKREICIRS